MNRTRRATRRLRSIVSAALGATALAVALAGSAYAVQPAQQACLGKDVSGYATALGGLHYLPGLVQASRPFGQALQVHLAGSLPDDIPNSCND